MKLPLPPSAPDLTFSVGFAGTRDLAFFLSFIDARKDRDEHTRILQLKAGKWGTVDVRFGATAVAGFVQPVPDIFVVGTEGNVLHGTRSGFASERIDDSPEGPKGKGWLRHARAIANSVYAVGMSRQAYRRPQSGAWARIDQGVLSGPPNIVGFDDIDGPTESELFAVGLDGEIWTYDGTKWSAIDSPTNVALSRVRSTPAGIYVCGGAGVVLVGTGGQFRALPDTGIPDNLYGLEWFNGRVYVASLTGLFVIDGDALTPVDFRLGEGVTTGFLTAAEGVLWSIGAKHLLRTFDGATWEWVEVKP